MEPNYIAFDLPKSITRIRSELDDHRDFEERTDDVPPASAFTYSNGFYVFCSALWVDIRNSSALPDRYKRPTLARIYRTYASEVCAILNGDQNCREISIRGDGILGIFNTPKKSDVDAVFEDAARISSLIQITNHEFEKRQMDPIAVGIGLASGRTLAAKAGYYGSGINDRVWLGPVINRATELGNYGNKEYGDPELMVDDLFYSNLKENYQAFLAWQFSRGCYGGHIINVAMNAWKVQAYGA